MALETAFRTFSLGKNIRHHGFSQPLLTTPSYQTPPHFAALRSSSNANFCVIIFNIEIVVRDESAQFFYHFCLYASSSKRSKLFAASRPVTCTDFLAHLTPPQVSSTFKCVHLSWAASRRPAWLKKPFHTAQQDQDGRTMEALRLGT